VLETLERRELLSTFQVQNTNDDTNAGSLRWAIGQANADSDPSSVITFAIGGTGVKTIALGSPLPILTHPTLIDGTTQGNYSGTPLIELDATALKKTDVALVVAAGGSTVRALAINNCLGTALLLSTKGGDTVAGCFIGTSADGTTAKANGLGISISGCSNNTIGGTGTNDLNLLSGNTTEGLRIGGAAASNGNTIEGNWIGIDITGKAALGNGQNGLLLDNSSGDVIRKNVISGNLNTSGANLQGNGIWIDNAFGVCDLISITQNSVGTSADGTAAVGNNGRGIYVVGGTDITVGGVGLGNLISGNGATGLRIDFPAHAVLVTGNTFGTDLNGAVSLPNGVDGIRVFSATIITIGGTAKGEGNLISGNSVDGIGLEALTGSPDTTHILIEGNIIGLNASGTGALANTRNGIFMQAADTVTIGGTAAGAQNIISGNATSGISLGTGINSVVQGNLIGTNISATVAVPNQTGILIAGASGALIGGTATGAGNVISGNLQAGIDSNGTASSNDVVQGNTIGASLVPTGQGINTRTSFDGLSFADSASLSAPGFVPPDTIAAVGKSYVMETVNTVLRISSKDGSSFSTTSLGSFFPLSVGTDLFDPVVFYDDIAGRFVVAALESPLNSAVSHLNVAFSDPGNETSFSNKYRIDMEEQGQFAADYPRFGFNADAIVFAVNMYNAQGTAFNNVQILSIATSSVGNASLTTVKIDRSSDFTDAPASMHGATPGEPMYFVEAEPVFPGPYADVHVLTWANPLDANSAFTDTVVPVPAYTDNTDAVQKGSTNNIQTNDTRMLSVAWRNNRLVAAHASDNSNNDPNVFWYEFQTDASDPTSTPKLTQSGNINQGSGVATFFPSIDINPAGDLGLTFMESSSNEFMSMYVTGQLAGSPAGTMLTPVLAKAGEATYTGFGPPTDPPPYRGGDFSGTGVDPTDGTFWTANEYANTDSGANWGTWIQQFSLQPASGLSYIRLANGTYGIRINGPTGMLIGGTTSSAANIIGANNSDGINTFTSSAGLLVEGNFIGTDPAGDSTLGNNGDGVHLVTSQNTVGGTAAGAGNVIAYNAGTGVIVLLKSNQDSILSNSIYNNGALGISLGNAPAVTPNHTWPPGPPSGFPNNYQNYPVLTSAHFNGSTIEIVGTLNAAASTAYTVQFFASPTSDPSGNGQGQIYLGQTTVTTDSSFNASFDVTLTPAMPIPSGYAISATATDPSGNTSEFAANQSSAVVVDVSLAASATSNSPDGKTYAGSLLTYTITVTNNGLIDAHGVVVTDVLDSNVTYQSSSTSVPSVIPTITGNAVTANFGTLSAGSTVTVTIVVLVNAGAVPGGISNVSNVTSTDLNTGSPTQVTLPTAVLPATDLAIASIATTPAPNYVGANLVYTISATNSGPSDATGVVVTDTLPPLADISNISATTSVSGVTAVINGNVVTADFGNLASGATVTVTITVQPTKAAGNSSLTNMASITGNEHDPDTTNNTLATTTTIVPSADLQVSISPSPSPVQAGQNVVYTITAMNNGLSDATGVVVTDTIPADVTFVSASGGAVPDATHTITFPAVSLPAGQTATYQVTVTTTGTTASPTTDSATVAGNEHDPNTSNNSASQSVTVQAVSDLSIGMTTSSPPTYVGNVLTYTITVNNSGPSSEPAAVVTDTLPANVTVQSATTSISGVNPIVSGNVVTANLGKLSSGGAATVTIKVIPQPAAAGTISNTATISGQNIDSNPNNNSVTVPTTVTPSADLAVSLSAPSAILVGQNLVYTITATNNGPSAATGVVVTDQLPPIPTDITFVSATGGAVPDATGKITFPSFGLAAGASLTFTITVQPTPAAVSPPPLSDTASISGNEFDPNLANNTAQQTTSVSPAVDLAVTQFTAAPNPIEVGSNLTYTIVVRNNGPSKATGVTVISPLTGATYVSGSGTVVPSGTVSPQGTSVVANVGTLAAGASATVTYVVTTTVFGNLTASTSVAANETDINPANNSATATTTVLDHIGTFEFSSAAYSVPENAGSAVITVNRVNGTRGTATVNYTTAPINAKPGIDYLPVSGTLVFVDGVTSQQIVVPVLANPYDKQDELVSVILSNVQSTETLGKPILGSPSTSTLTIQDIDPNFTPLAVTNVQWTGTVSDIRQIFVTFSHPLITSTAINPANYSLVNVGADGRFGTLDDLGVQITAPSYDPSIFTVTLTPSQPLQANRFFHLFINGATSGGIEDIGGNMLAGDGVIAGTNYTALLARGTSLKYFTPAGDQVTLKITGGGIIDDLLDGTGLGRKFTVVGEVPHRTVLTGSVKKMKGGTGRAYIGPTVYGLGQFGDVRVKMYSPPFQVSYYPFSPGSSAALTARALIRLDGSVAKASATPVVRARAAKSPKVASATVAPGARKASHVKPMSRPFMAFHR
jgi:uncharacterized repeat protein (TIGR01451 family)